MGSAEDDTVRGDITPVIATNRIRVTASTDGLASRVGSDLVSVEEPLEISLAWRDARGAEREQVLTVTMRTPGDDEALALGLLHAEGIIRDASEVLGTNFPEPPGPTARNRLQVQLAAGVQPDLGDHHRNLVTHSSCGVCGRTSLQAIEIKQPPAVDDLQGWLDADLLLRLGEEMRTRQSQFSETGGVHAAGLFDPRRSAGTAEGGCRPAQCPGQTGGGLPLRGGIAPGGAAHSDPQWPCLL